MKIWHLFIMILCIALFSACQANSTEDESTSNDDIQSNIEVDGDMDMEDDLIISAENGETEKVLELLDRGVDINLRDSQERTAVVAATQNHRTETVKALIQQGADIDIQNNIEDNVLLYASAEGLLDIVKLAIEADADTNLTNRYGGTALIPAADRGHIEIVEELLKHSDVDVNHINNLNWTALLEAIILGDGGESHTEIVQLLVDYGADVSISDGNGITPLEHAVNNGYKEIENILREAGAQ